MNDIRDIDRKDCTGCGACLNACLANVITMSQDREGFLYPILDEQRCVACGKCLRSCVAHAPKQIMHPLYISQAQAMNVERRMAASSGGIIGLLAEAILKDNGVVFGAAYFDSQKTVCHTSTENVPLDRILRSKYVQSDTGDIYRQVKTSLDAGRKVLFTGTPCQVEALGLFLNKEYENLLTVDFMCHGVPSRGLFSDYIKYVENQEGRSSIDVSFRDKEFGWRNWRETFRFSDGNIKTVKRIDSIYYQLFLNNCSLRHSCSSCRRNITHVADITVADAWRITGDDDTGMSTVFIRTEKGKKWYDIIFPEMNVTDLTVGEVDIEFYLHQINEKARRKFFNTYVKRGLGGEIDTYFKIVNQAKKQALKRAKWQRVLNHLKNKTINYSRGEK